MPGMDESGGENGYQEFFCDESDAVLGAGQRAQMNPCPSVSIRVHLWLKNGGRGRFLRSAEAGEKKRGRTLLRPLIRTTIKFLRWSHYVQRQKHNTFPDSGLSPDMGTNGDRPFLRFFRGF